MTESKTELRTFSELSAPEKTMCVAALVMTLSNKHQLKLEQAMELSDFLYHVFINRSFDEKGDLQDE